MRLHKSIYYAALASAMVLSSCQKDEQDVAEVSVAGNTQVSETVFSARIANHSKPQSKTSLDDGSSLACGGGSDVYFAEDDRIAVFNAEGDKSLFRIAYFLYDDEVLFKGEIAESDAYYAVYPYHPSSKIDGSVITATLPDRQDAMVSTFDDKAALSVARTYGDSKSLLFEPVTAMISFEISETIYRSITIETLDETPIAGEFTIKPSDDADGLPEISGGTLSKVVLEGKMQYQSCFVNLLPATIAADNLKITFTRKDGSSFSQIIDQEVVLEPGVCLNYGQPFHTIEYYDEEGDFADEVIVYDGNSYTIRDSDYEIEEGYIGGWATKPVIDGGVLKYAYDEVIYPTESFSLYPATVKETKHHVKIHGLNDKVYEFDVIYKDWFELDLEDINVGNLLVDGLYTNPELKGEKIEVIESMFFMNYDEDLELYASYKQFVKVVYYDSNQNEISSQYFPYDKRGSFTTVTKNILPSADRVGFTHWKAENGFQCLPEASVPFFAFIDTDTDIDEYVIKLYRTLPTK